MPVYLDVESRLDGAAAAAAARKAVEIFTRAGNEASAGLGSGLSRAFASLDTSKARAEVDALSNTYRRMQAAEAEAARQMELSLGKVEVAQKRLAEVTAKHGADSAKAAAANVALADSHAVAARAQRDHADAMFATEAAAGRMATAADKAGSAVTNTGRVFNGVGMASAAAFGAAMISSTKAAGDFQASQERLVASAGESAGNLKTVSDGVLNLAGQVGFSAQSLSDAMYGVEKAGFRGADGVNVLKAAAQGAKSENADLHEVLSGLTTSMTDFDKGPAQAADVMSKMVAAVGMSKTNFQTFAGALHSVEPIASAVHMRLEDVYGALAQITQSGTSPDQAAQNMAHAISSLSAPTQVMSNAMGQFGLNAADVAQHLGDRGLAGTVQVLADAITKQMDPAGRVVIDTMFKNEQAVQSATTMFDAMPPAVQAVAKSIQDGDLSFKEYRKTRGGLSVDQANQLNQWYALEQRIQGYSTQLKQGKGSVETFMQALTQMVGGQDAARIALQLTGENADAANQKIKDIAAATTDANGQVLGFAETQATFNTKMDQFKASMGAARIELGEDFLPVMTEFADGLKTTAGFLADHKAIMDGLVITTGAFATAWLGVKAAMAGKAVFDAVQTAVSAIATKFGTVTVAAETANTTMAGAGAAAAEGAVGVEAAAAREIAAEDGVAAAGGRAAGILKGVGIAAAGTMAADAIGGYAQDHTSGFWHSAAVVGTDAAKGAAIGGGIGSVIPVIGTGVGAAIGGAGAAAAGIFNQIAGHAGGGPLNAPGPTGVDSALFWGADGEHVLTADDVDALGGHTGVYALRASLHRRGRYGHRGNSAPDPAPGPIDIPKGDKADPLFIKLADPRQLASGMKEGVLEGSGRAGAGGMQFGAPLPENFGLNEGLGGLAKWAVTFLADLVVAPMEAAMMKPFLGADDETAPGVPSSVGGAGGGFADLGDVGTPITGGSSAGGGFGGASGANPSAASLSTPVASPAPPAATPPRPLTGPYTYEQALLYDGDAINGEGDLTDGTGTIHPFNPSSAPVATPLGDLLSGNVSSRGKVSPLFPTTPSTLQAPGDIPSMSNATIGMPISAGRRDLGPEVFDRDAAPTGFFGSAVPHRATGGPMGTDTIPTWTSPGEFVEQKSAVDKYGPDFMQALNAGKIPLYRAKGGETEVPEGTPIGSTGTPSPGMGVSGGALGAAEGAAASAASIIPGGGAAVQIASQMLNRTAAYAGQVAGIGVEGLLSTFLPSGSPLSDFGNTLPGKILAGIAGAKPAAPITAGNTKAPLTKDDDEKSGKRGGDLHIHGMTVHANNAEEFERSIAARNQQDQRTAEHAIPMLRVP